MPPQVVAQIATDDDAMSLTVLRDIDDNAHFTHSLLQAHAPSCGVVIVHPTPGVSSVVGLAHDVLLALGHSCDRVGAHGVTGPESAWRAVTAWIRGDDIEHLVVLRAHRLSVAQHLRLLRLRGDTGLHLVLVWHSPQRVRLGPVPLTGLPHRITDDLREVTARLARSRCGTWAAVVHEELPPVPDNDATTFLAEAAAVLSPAEYSRVAAVHARAVEATTRRLTEHGDAPGRAKRFGWLGPDNTDLAERMLDALQPQHAYLRTLHENRPPGAIRDWRTAVGLYRFLGALVADSPGRNHTITRLRGAQAAFQRHALRLALPPNLAYMVGPGLTTTPITDHVIARIRARTANPAHAAALATLLFSGATAAELESIPRLALTDDALIFISPSGIDRPADVCVWAIPAPARPLLHAAAVFQESRDDAAGALFVDGIGAGMTGRLHRSAHACGLHVPALHRWRDGWVHQTGGRNLAYRTTASGVDCPRSRRGRTH